MMLMGFIGNEKETKIPVSRLFDVIIGQEKKDDRWPKDSMRLGKQLRQLAPTIRSLGFEVTTTKYNARDGDYPRGTTIVKITKIVEKGVDSFANGFDIG